ncbi:MAG: hypothetical protein KAJ52_03055 [Sedimentisphaerales bacterium]|nr:hypothetical protein [Sedimentisphaerales bacterium]
MYRICLVIGFMLVLAAIALHQKSMRDIITVKSGGRKRVLTQKSLGQIIMQKSFGQIIVMLIRLATFLCFVVLAVTGFYPAMFTGEPLSGYSLMLHATASPVLAVCLVALVLVTAQRNRFDRKDWDHLQMRFSWKSFDEHSTISSATVIWRKVFFWLMILLSLPVMLSIVLSMFPIFGTSGQEFLYHLHRYVTLLFVMSGALFGYLAIVSQARQSAR